MVFCSSAGRLHLAQPRGHGGADLLQILNLARNEPFL
jgi:hypothetical protein